MTEQYRLLTIERDLALSLSKIDDEQNAIRAAADAIADVDNKFGVAVEMRRKKEPLGEYRGCLATAAGRVATDKTSDGLISISIPLGDTTSGQGRIIVVSQKPILTDPSIVNSIERVGSLLSENLRRISASNQLKEALKDQKLLIREIRHRVRNSLQLIQNMIPLMIPSSTNPEDRGFEDLERRIAALISIHDMLNWTETKDLVRAGTYFWVLSNALRRLTIEGVGTFVSTYESEEDPELPVDRATTIGLVVYELVTNSTKHAEGRPIRMDLRVKYEEGVLAIRYSDGVNDAAGNGKSERFAMPRKAMNTSKRRYENESGLKIMNALLIRARGKRIDDGTTPHHFEARFPIAEG